MRRLVCSLMLVGLSLQAWAADNPYTKHYVDRSQAGLPLQPDPAGPKLFRGTQKDVDAQKMLVKGYDLIGEAAFNATETSPELALEQAKKIKADLVLVYGSVLTKTPTSVQLDQLRAQSKAGEALDLKEDTPIYQYGASYWVKLAPPLIGIHVNAKASQDQGLSVIAVVEGSPAEQAGIRQGDVVTAIGNSAIVKVEALSEAAKRYAGQAVPVYWLREGQVMQSTLKVNTRP